MTAVSELARNMIVYAGSGRVIIEDVSDNDKQGVRVVCVDDGPGIPDITEAMEDGFTTGNGLGLGLPGAKRLVDEFEIESQTGLGTKISVTRWKR